MSLIDGQLEGCSIEPTALVGETCNVTDLKEFDD